MSAKWIAFSRQDIGAAESLLRDGYYPLSCFHAQQAVEKGLKAFLLHNGQIPPRTHLLVDLLNSCIAFETSLFEYLPQCGILDQYYIPTRYPDAPIPLSLGQPEAQEALEYAHAILSDIETLISPTSADIVTES